jgi:hypothetical protein
MSATPAAARAAAPVDRAAVWNYLRGEHAEVAARLRAEESRIAGCVALDGLPEGSRTFLWSVLRRWKPGLAHLLSEDNDFREIRARLEGSVVAIDTEDLIEAVWGHLQQGSVNSPRR